ncbi:MAG: beta-hexosaminidase, partial [Rhodobacteraceae bacterium]|nr:beta-hexosaminidase [Paracoccaceae bacterium]
DSHLKLPQCTLPLEALEARDFAPVRALADLPLGMTGHMVIEALDPGTPATLSPVVIGYLRSTLGFQGLLMTDDLSMNALPGTLPDRAARAIAAGCDLVLHCSGALHEMDGVVAASGALRAGIRADRALGARRTPAPIDIAAATAEFERLSNPQV